jgi:hypothetical protein
MRSLNPHGSIQGIWRVEHTKSDIYVPCGPVHPKYYKDHKRYGPHPKPRIPARKSGVVESVDDSEI